MINRIKKLLGLDIVDNAMLDITKDIFTLTKRIGITPEEMSRSYVDLKNEFEDYLFSRIMANTSIGMSLATNENDMARLIRIREEVNKIKETK